MWKRLYDCESSMDGGTLHRNLINRVNVGRKEVKNQASEVEDFLELVITCHLLAAAMPFFGMASVEDVPSGNCFPDEVKSMSKSQMASLLQDRMLKVIDEYVVPQEFIYSLNANTPEPSGSEIQTNPHVTRIQHDHSYIMQQEKETSKRQRTLPPLIANLSSTPRSTPETRKQVKDGVFEYASAVLNDGLLLLEFKDAIREMVIEL